MCAVRACVLRDEGRMYGRKEGRKDEDESRQEARQGNCSSMENESDDAK